MIIWETILEGFHTALVFLHDALDGFFGEAAWGWAIIALTVLVRVLLLPLAVKQTRSMRAMQQLQPKIKQLQKKHKVDRELLKKDPETYRKKKQKLNEEMMALYKDEGVNPASGCLPLLLQAPIFFALFRVLQDDKFTDLAQAPFYFLTSQVDGLGANASAAGWPGWLLIFLMAATMFWSQRQMLSKTQAEGAQAQQQKVMMYVMPVFLAGISLNFPLGVLLYWVTTNFWQMGQQYVIMKEVQHELAEEARERKKKGGGRGGASKGKSQGKSKGKGAAGGRAGSGGKPSAKDEPKSKGKGSAARPKDAAPSGNGDARRGGRTEAGSTPEPPKTKKRKRDHLPRRADN